MWFIGVEVEQETSAHPPKKILDPPLFLVVSFEKTCQKLWLLASSRRVSNTSKQMKALG